MEYKICEECPMNAACEAARTIANMPGHKDPTRTLGGISLTQQALEAVVTQIGCEQPTINNNGQRVCPNESASMNARSMGSAPWPEGAYNVILDRVVSSSEPEQTEQTGLYL